MTTSRSLHSGNNEDSALPDGPAAAAILSSTVGCLVIGVLTVGAVISRELNMFLNFYAPAGPLSGKTTIGVLVWLCLWFILHRQWRKRTVGLGSVFFWSCVALAIGLVLTFPPFFELFASH